MRDLFGQVRVSRFDWCWAGPKKLSIGAVELACLVKLEENNQQGGNEL